MAKRARRIRRAIFGYECGFPAHGTVAVREQSLLAEIASRGHVGT